MWGVGCIHSRYARINVFEPLSIRRFLCTLSNFSVAEKILLVGGIYVSKLKKDFKYKQMLSYIKYMY